MTTLYAEVDKTKIADLPQVLFSGRIVVIETAESAEKAVDFLCKEKILGVDTETRPSFRKGITYKVALLQVYYDLGQDFLASHKFYFYLAKL